MKENYRKKKLSVFHCENSKRKQSPSFVQQNLANVCIWENYCKIISQNILLEAYSEPLCKNSKRLLVNNCFRKNAPF